MNGWIIVAIVGAVFFAASIRELPEQIIVGALAYMIANGHDWHTAIVIAIALAAAALTIILQSYDDKKTPYANPEPTKSSGDNTAEKHLA